jgi:hypothetical protein
MGKHSFFSSLFFSSFSVFLSFFFRPGIPSVVCTVQRPGLSMMDVVIGGRLTDRLGNLPLYILSSSRRRLSLSLLLVWTTCDPSQLRPACVRFRSAVVLKWNRSIIVDGRTLIAFNPIRSRWAATFWLVAQLLVSPWRTYRYTSSLIPGCTCALADDWPVVLHII